MAMISFYYVDEKLTRTSSNSPPLLQGQGFPIGICQIEHILKFIKLHIFFLMFFEVYLYNIYTFVFSLRRISLFFDSRIFSRRVCIIDLSL